MSKKFDVIAIGNAIVDIVAKVDEKFLENNDLIKSSMSLTDQEESDELYSQLKNPVKTSGGSAANTVAGVASLGGSAAFIGKVNDDELGKIFAKDLKDINVSFETNINKAENSTAKCIVAVTDDAQRTMATYLGAATEINKDDIEENAIANSKILYLEGYLWDRENAKEAIISAINFAKNNGVKVAFTLSDPFCVDRHREEFLQLIKDHIDIVFANEVEIRSLFETDDLNMAKKEISKLSEISAVTLGENGSIILSADGEINISPIKDIKVLDTTGAGDLYASGFLYGLVNNLPLKKCGEIANIVASEIIKDYGARSKTNLSDLIT